MAKANSNFNFHPVFFQTQRRTDAEFFLSLEICCFRHLEKPIKTKENKIKPFVFICFYWFCSVFLDGESKYFKRRDAEFFYEHEMHERNENDNPNNVEFYLNTEKVCLRPERRRGRRPKGKPKGKACT